MKKYYLKTTKHILSTCTMIAGCYAEGWDHIRAPLGAQFPSNTLHEYSNPYQTGQKITTANEYTQDFDNTGSTTLFATKTAEIQKWSALQSDSISFVSTYVYSDEMAAWARKMIEYGNNDQGPIASGIGHFYAGAGPRRGATQEEFKATYPHSPAFFGNIETLPEHVASDPSKANTLMFNNTPKAFGAFERAFGALTAEDIIKVESLENLATKSSNPYGNIYISMAPGQSLDYMTLNPNDTIYHMGGYYQRGNNPMTLGYNTATGMASTKRLLDHAAAHKKPLRFINSQLCDMFTCSSEFWTTLVDAREELHLSFFQLSLLEEAIHWQAYLDNRLSTSIEEDIHVVKTKKKSPIFSDPLTVYISLSEIFPDFGPKLYGTLYKYAPYHFDVHPEVEALAGGYMGTKNSKYKAAPNAGEEDTRAEDEKNRWLQHPSVFFDMHPTSIEEANVLIAEPADGLTKEMCTHFAEQGILEALCFSDNQKEILYSKLPNLS